MKIAVIGAGSVGGTLGRRFVEAGNAVCFGVPSPSDQKYQDLVKSIGAGASVATVRESVVDAEMVVLATPWDATRAAIDEAGELSGRTIVDCTNPLKFESGALALALGYSTSGGEEIAQWAAGGNIVKAFNTTGFGNMANPKYHGESSIMFVCGGDQASKEAVI